MAHSDGPDAYPAEVQLDMFGAPPATSYPGPQGVLVEPGETLAKVDAVPGEPLGAADAAHLRDTVSRMAERLPADEAGQLRLELDSELERLTAA